MGRSFEKHRNKSISCIVCLVIVMLLLSNVVYGAKMDASSEVDGDTGASVSKKVKLTKKEEAFQKQHPTITIVADASWRPLEYLDDETKAYAGVIPEILSKLEQYTGFKIKYQVKDSYAEALETVQSGKADMISGLANDEVIAKEYNVRLTDPYITVNSSIVTKNAWKDLYDNQKKKRIAVIEGDYANSFIQREIPNVTLIPCQSNEECFDMVKDEKVDMAILASYCTEYYMSIPKYSALKSHAISSFSWKLSLGVSNKQSPLLTSIMNKGIQKMSQWDVNQAVYTGVINAAYDNDWLVLVYNHPVTVIGGLLLIVLLVGMLVSTIIIIRRKENNRKIQDGVRLRLALERTHLCIWELDMKTKSITKIDNEQEHHGFYNLRKNVPESAIEAGYVHPEDIATVRETIAKVLNGEKDITSCWRILDIEDKSEETTYWWEQVSFYIVSDERNKPIRVIGVSEDVTNEKIAQRDSLTSVYNRKSFEEKATFVLNERRNSYLKCAFLILDLDGFKKINDTYGHTVGDQVLMSVGTAIAKTFRSSDIVGRLGGDEFTVFMTAINQPSDVSLKAEELVRNIHQIQGKEGYKFPISCSVGVVITNRENEDLQTLYKKADVALYEAKRAGKNQFKIYEERE